MSKTSYSLPQLHEISSNCIKDLLKDKISEKKANSVATHTSQILNIVKIQLQGYKAFGKGSPEGFNPTEVLYGN